MAKRAKSLEDFVNAASCHLNDASSGGDLSAATSDAPIKVKRAARELGKCFVRKRNGKTAIEARHASGRSSRGSSRDDRSDLSSCTATQMKAEIDRIQVCRRRSSRGGGSALEDRDCPSGRSSRGDGGSSRDDRSDLSSCTATQMKVEIDRIQRLIDSDGGRHGFWDPRDHDHFLRLLPKIPDRTELCERVSNEIPDTSPQQVAEHFEWYHRYCAYEKRKKEIVVQWKDAKKAEAEKSICEHEKQSEEKQRHMRKLAEERDAERRKKAAAVREWKKLAEEREAERRKKAAAVRKWKEQREALEKEAAEREEAAALYEKNIHRSFLKRQARERAQRIARAKTQKEIEKLELAKLEAAERRANRPVITKAQRLKLQARVMAKTKREIEKLELAKREAADRMLEARKARIADKENRSREMEERVRSLADRLHLALDVEGDFSRLTGSTPASADVKSIQLYSRPAIDVKGDFSRLTGDTAAMKSRRERNSKENVLRKQRSEGRPGMPPAYYPGSGRRAQASWRQGVR